MAVKTRSLWPGVVFHAVNNGLAVVLGLASEKPGFAPIAQVLYRRVSTAQYRIEWIVVGVLASAAMIGYLWKRPDDAGAKSTISEAV